MSSGCTAVRHERRCARQRTPNASASRSSCTRRGLPTPVDAERAPAALVAGAYRHLAALAATARGAGSEAEERARGYCAAELARLGFEVTEERFEYSTFPGRYATPAGGALSTGTLLAAIGYAGVGQRDRALAVAVIGLLCIVGAAVWLARRGVLALPLARRGGVNLIATRPPRPPVVWLMAHLDSKSQPVAILVRAAGITVHAVVWAGALLAVTLASPDVTQMLWLALAIAAVASALPIIASVVRDRSPGARDNASGVAAVLIAAAQLESHVPVGVVLTTAEELGLAGARAWVRSRRAGTALNCDTTDDAGVLTAMYTGRRPVRVANACVDAAAALGVPFGVRRLLPGILTDGVALADAGWEAVTLSRGTVATLRRLHRPSDRLDGLSGEGSATAGRVMAVAAARLTRGEGA